MSLLDILVTPIAHACCFPCAITATTVSSGMSSGRSAPSDVSPATNYNQTTTPKDLEMHLEMHLEMQWCRRADQKGHQQLCLPGHIMCAPCITCLIAPLSTRTFGSILGSASHPTPVMPSYQPELPERRAKRWNGRQRQKEND